MKATSPGLPSKTREFKSRVIDSTIWNDFEFRDGDIVIATYAKSGTTWMQQIVGQLVFNGEEVKELLSVSPWMEFPYLKEAQLETLERQAHRRFIKSHLPADALIISPRAKYVSVARDGRDVAWSHYRHLLNLSEDFIYKVNSMPENKDYPPFERPSGSVREFFNQWLDAGGINSHPIFWETVKSWWNFRELPNVLLLHFNELKNDLPGQIRRIADFLDIPVDPDKWDAIVAHCGFEYMRANSETLLARFRFKSQKSFFHKGVNKRWQDVLSDAENRRYEELAKERLGEDCAHWLLTGSYDGIH